MKTAKLEDMIKGWFVGNFEPTLLGKFGIYSIDKSAMHGTGTPEDLDKYIAGVKEKQGALV